MTGFEKVEFSRYNHQKAMEEFRALSRRNRFVHPMGALAIVHEKLRETVEDRESLKLSRHILEARLSQPGALDIGEPTRIQRIYRDMIETFYGEEPLHLDYAKMWTPALEKISEPIQGFEIPLPRMTGRLVLEENFASN